MRERFLWPPGAAAVGTLWFGSSESRRSVPGRLSNAYCITSPPSTLSDWPVMYEASSEASITAAFATSSGR